LSVYQRIVRPSSPYTLHCATLTLVFDFLLDLNIVPSFSLGKCSNKFRYFYGYFVLNLKARTTDALTDEQTDGQDPNCVLLGRPQDKNNDNS